MWKIVTAIAGVVLLGAAFLSYQNKAAYESEITARKSAEANLDKTQAMLTKKEEELKTAENAIVQVEQELEKTKAEITTVSVSVSEEEKKENGLNDELEQIIGEIASAQDLIDKVGDIEAIEKDMVGKQMEVQRLSQDLASARNREMIARGRQKAIQSRIDEFLKLERDQLNGNIRERLTASVSGVYDGWGFVVINAGDKQGVFPKAELDVLRQGNAIARLQVTNVEPGRSVASIVPGTLQEGQTIRPGDLVRPAMNPQPAAAEG